MRMAPLAEYKKKRDFKKTAEPGAVFARTRKGAPLTFVVQEHHASHLHYDFRLEWEGVLKSWAVPKGPSMDPGTKRLAVEVEDHPLAYASFTGTIPADEYGGGEVFRWDHGTWQPRGDAAAGLRKGRLEFTLKGKKLKGDWIIVRTGRPSRKPQWLLIKRHDSFASGGEASLSSPEQKKKKKFAMARAARKGAAARTRRGEAPFVPLQLARLVERPPVGEHWVHEMKFDGYRTEALLGGGVRLLTRTGQDWTHRYPPIAAALGKLKVKEAVLDGEIVWADKNGSDFQKLQNALSEEKHANLRYYVFDILSLNGEDLRPLPLGERKERLAKLLAPLKKSVVLYSEHFAKDAEKFLARSCDTKMEGIISKRIDAPYVSGRHDYWVKSKCKQRQEFVVGGFTAGEGARVGFGALLLGTFEKGKLRYVGKVGTGFSQRSLRELRRRLRALETAESPFAQGTPRARDTHWVEPKLVAEVSFANWTAEKRLRAPVFVGLREDKPAEDIRREEPAKPELTLSHPDKLYFEAEEITKLEVARYYAEVAPWMLPHVERRPLSLMRCPDGSGGECFFQKHMAESLPAFVKPLKVAESAGNREQMTIDDAEGLLALVQWGTIEFHVWNSRGNENPDQIVMDFDPGPGVEWKQVVRAALELKEILDGLKLESFVKVTGGKGIHVHVPFAPRYGWDEVKAFAQTLAQEMASRRPSLYTTQIAKKARDKKIFLDYLRNGRTATAVAPYSLRAREMSAVAMPVSWEELKKLKGASQFTLKEALNWLRKRKRDPWARYFLVRQTIGILDPAKGRRQ